MDMMDVLGSLLGQKTTSGSKGGDVLNDILKGRRPQPSGPSASRTTGTSPTDIAREAKELEDLLNVANDRQSRTSPSSPSTTRSSTPTRQTHTNAPSPNHETSADGQRALILVRAMVNAAKADGRIDQSEQDSIIKHLSNPTRESIDFLRKEFDRPLDVREFAMSVPVGMEQQVYMMSLAVINLDSGDEAKYLMELAELLRLPMDVREQIHQRLGAPSIY